jgi:hypothetical protein
MEPTLEQTSVCKSNQTKCKNLEPPWPKIIYSIGAAGAGSRPGPKLPPESRRKFGRGAPKFLMFMGVAHQPPETQDF